MDEKLFRSDIRTDPSTGAARAGTPLALTIKVQNLSSAGCAPLTGAYVDIWHCDAKGIYSDEPSYNPGGGTGTVVTSGQKFLRGYQITDENGQVQFTTIYPGWYSGRTIHIHVRVRTYSGMTVLSNFVTQIFFDETVNNTSGRIHLLAQLGARYHERLGYGLQRLQRDANADDAHGQRGCRIRGRNYLRGDVSNPRGSAPAIASGGVGNAVSGAAGVTPGAWISIYGSALASTTRLGARPTWSTASFLHRSAASACRSTTSRHFCSM